MTDVEDGPDGGEDADARVADGEDADARVADDDGEEADDDSAGGDVDAAATGSAGGDETEDGRATVVVRGPGGETTLNVRPGRVLRDVLRDHGLSPYTALTERANCGGRGLCATCGVRLREGPPPDHWHDRLADRFGYPRLSCQVAVEDGMVVELDAEKVVWGRRESE